MKNFKVWGEYMFSRKREEVSEKIENKELKSISNEDGEKILNDIISNFISEKSILINSIERKLQNKDVLKNEVENYLSKKGYKFNEGIYKSFETRIWGYGELQPLLEIDDITDIKIIKDRVRIKILGKRSTSNIKFASKKAAAEYINRIAVKNNITLSEINAQQIITDKKSSDKYILRIDFSSDFIDSDDCPYMHIRLIPKKKLVLSDLNKKGMFDSKVQEHIEESIESGISILVCGKNGCGKTYFMNAALEEIPHDKSGLAVQESGELFSNTHPDLVFQEVKKLVGESKVQYTLQDLIRHGLVSDFDWFIVGEIKGAESWDSVNASYTGSSFMSSLHTLNAKSAPSKMVHYMKYSPNSKDMSEADLLETLVGIDEIYYIEDFKLKEITQIAGFDKNEGDLILHPIFKYQSNGNQWLNDNCAKVKEKIEDSKLKNVV